MHRMYQALRCSELPYHVLQRSIDFADRLHMHSFHANTTIPAALSILKEGKIRPSILRNTCEVHKEEQWRRTLLHIIAA